MTVAHHEYRRMLITQEKRLEGLVTEDASMRYMVPALLGRRVQLAVNTWLGNQSRSALPIQFPTLTDVLHDFHLGRRWEPTFPVGYLHSTSTGSLPAQAVSIAGTAPTIAGSTVTSGGSSLTSASTITGPSAPTNSASAQPTNSLVRNLAFNEAAFGTYKAMNIKARTLKDQLRTRNVSCPNNGRGEPMCLTYHVHGMCNARCRFAADQIAHTPAEDETFSAWCAQHYCLD